MKDLRTMAVGETVVEGKARRRGGDSFRDWLTDPEGTAFLKKAQGLMNQVDGIFEDALDAWQDSDAISKLGPNSRKKAARMAKRKSADFKAVFLEEVEDL